MRAVWLGAVLAIVACSRGGRATGLEQAAVRWDAPTEVATGGGTRGEWRQNDSDYDHVDDGTVTFDARGRLLVAWVDQDRKDVFLRRVDARGRAELAKPVNVSRTPAVFSWLPRIATAGDDVYVLWQEIVFSGGTHGGEAFFARSTDGGKTFAAPQNLSQSRNGDGKGRITAKVWHNGSLDLAIARDGTLYAAWTEFDGPLWISRSRDRGASFSAPLRIADRAPARAPAIATGPGGDVYIAWTAGDDAGADLRMSRSTDGGVTFSPPALITRTPHYSDAPKLGFDRQGTLHLVWGESTGGPFDRFTIRYARSRDHGVTFDAPRTLSARGGTSSSAFPMLAIEDATVVVSWETASGARERPRGLALAYSIDGGATFTAPTAVPHSVDPGGGSNGSHQGHLMEKLALAGGQIAITNSALAQGRGSRVWVVTGSLPARVATRR